jgi:hypothetical protein
MNTALLQSIEGLKRRVEMEKVKLFGGNGKYQRIWWYRQSEKKCASYIRNNKKNPSTMSRRNQGTRQERTRELVILKPQSKQEHGGERRSRNRLRRPGLMLPPATFAIIVSQNRVVLLAKGNPSKLDGK